MTRYFCGIDWASEKHDLCILGATGAVLLRGSVSHTAEGMKELLQTLERFPGVQIALERPSGLLVDTLLEAGHRVVPIHPNQLKATRSRYPNSQAVSDPSDAYILADMLRTDGHRFRLLRASSDETKALRAATRTRDELVETRVQTCNQLRDLLLSFWPGPVGLFHQLESRISLAFLRRYPTPQHAARLGEKRVDAFLKKNSYPGGKSAAELLAKLRSAPESVAGDAECRMKGELVLCLLEVIAALKEQIQALERQIAEAFAEHADAAWLASFPCMGTTSAAQILAEAGDERARYPSEGQLAAESGVVPVTRGSGKKKTVVFRFACNKRLRKAVTCWANNSRKKSPWAERKYREAIERGCSHQHTVRILARAWLRVFWRCWQEGVPYDPAKHGGARKQRALPKAA
jgi:transposase